MASANTGKCNVLSCLGELLNKAELQADALNPGNSFLVHYNNVTDGPGDHWSIATFTVSCYDFNYEKEIVTIFGTLGTASGPLGISILIDGCYNERNPENRRPKLILNDGKKDDEGRVNGFGTPAFIFNNAS